MSQEKKSDSREFRAQVVLEAVSGKEVTPAKVAEKYDIEPALILQWAREIDITDVKLEELEEEIAGGAGDGSVPVELETVDQIFADEVEFGATFDVVNMKTLNYWIIYGSTFVTLIVAGLIAIFYFNSVSTTRQVSERSDYYQIRALKLEEQERLSSFGVVDLDEGIYRIPVDSVITRMAPE